MKDLTTLESGALRTALRRMPAPDATFYVNDFRDMCRIAGVSCEGRDMSALALLHCVKWADMDAPVRKEAQRVVLETFGAAPALSEVFVEAHEDPKPAKVSVFRRLVSGGRP